MDRYRFTKLKNTSFYKYIYMYNVNSKFKKKSRKGIRFVYKHNLIWRVFVRSTT